jgi:hypothetical protein
VEVATAVEVMEEGWVEALTGVGGGVSGLSHRVRASRLRSRKSQRMRRRVLFTVAGGDRARGFPFRF